MSRMEVEAFPSGIYASIYVAWQAASQLQSFREPMAAQTGDSGSVSFELLPKHTGGSGDGEHHNILQRHHTE